jgi:hypothetical protein
VCAARAALQTGCVANKVATELGRYWLSQGHFQGKKRKKPSKSPMFLTLKRIEKSSEREEDLTNF